MVRFHPCPHMNKDKKIKIKAEQTGLRLDVFLSEKLELSRSQVQKMILKDQVLLNNKQPKKAGDKVEEGDIVEITEKTDKNEALQKTKESNTKKSADLINNKIEIISETPDYIIINKPAGLLVHPTEANEKNTLVDWLVAKYPEIKKISDPFYKGKAKEGTAFFRPGIVHRLDKEASGLMVLARTQAMFDHLKQQFKNRTIEKEYLALAHGKFDRNWSEINFPISRSKNSDRMAAVPENNAEAKDAKTEFVVEKQFVNCALLRVTIHTGRSHQIRVHMLAYNHPLVGDTLYYQKKRKNNLDVKLGRLFLHSAKLGFTDLNGKQIKFELALPEKLENFIATLK